MIMDNYSFMSLWFSLGVWYLSGVCVLGYFFYLERNQPKSMIWTCLAWYQKVLAIIIIITIAPFMWPSIIARNDLDLRK